MVINLIPDYKLATQAMKAYPSAKPLSGVDVTHTINFGIYTGGKITDCTHQIIYKVTDTAKFTFLSLKTVEGEVVPVDE